MWQRHSHPLSGWTRSLSQPLLCLPLWNRSWAQAAAVALWLAVNPIIFPAPAHKRAWMTRAILGEQLWVAQIRRQIKAGQPPLRDRALWLELIQGLLLDGSLLYAWRRRARPTALLNGGAIVFNLWYLDRMASFYDQHQASADADQADQSTHVPA